MKIKLPDSWQYYNVDIYYNDSHPVSIVKTVHFMMNASGEPVTLFSNEDPGLFDVCWPSGDIVYFAIHRDPCGDDMFLLYNPKDESEQWIECHLDQLKTFVDHKQLFSAILSHRAN